MKKILSILIFTLSLFFVLTISPFSPKTLKIDKNEEMSKAENQTKTTRNLVVKGKSCKEDNSHQLECTYQVGKDLNVVITGIGQPDTAITYMKSDFEGDFYATYDVMHGCIIVKRGPKGINRDQLCGPGSSFDYAFISPKNGKVYTNWKDCQSAY